MSFFQRQAYKAERKKMKNRLIIQRGELAVEIGYMKSGRGPVKYTADEIAEKQAEADEIDRVLRDQFDYRA